MFVHKILKQWPIFKIPRRLEIPNQSQDIFANAKFLEDHV